MLIWKYKDLFKARIQCYFREHKASEITSKGRSYEEEECGCKFSEEENKDKQNKNFD